LTADYLLYLLGLIRKVPIFSRCIPDYLITEQTVMDTTRLALQMIAIQKAIFDNSFMSMVVMQNYTQNMMEGYLRYFPWLTQSHKKPLMASLEQIKQARSAYKQSVDQSFAQLEEMLYHKQTPTPPVPADPEPAKTAEPAKSEPAAAAPKPKAAPASAPAQEPTHTPSAESAPAASASPKKPAAPRKRATPAKKTAAKTTESATKFAAPKKAAPKRTAAKKTTPAARRTTKTAAAKSGDETAS
jgi:outer membrane biosynthesis protein TonB